MDDTIEVYRENLIKYIENLLENDKSGVITIQTIIQKLKNKEV